MKKPKYIVLKESIKESIRKGDYNVGDRLPSENELAQDLEVSRHTVLKGMSQLMAEGWIERQQGRGTFVAARSEGSFPGSRTVALICCDLSDSLVMHIVAGLSGFLKEQKYELLVLDTDHSTEREAEYLDSLEDRGVVGAFFWPHLPPANRDRVEILHKRGFNIVFLDRGYKDLKVPVVGTANEEGAYEVTRHLIEQGHRHIAHLTLEMKSGRFMEPINDRERGFRRALEESDIPFNHDFIQYVDYEVAEQLALSPFLRGVLAYEAMHRLLSLPQRPTAVFLLNDLFAPSCIRAIENQGLSVPNDIALAGFDNAFEAGEFSVPLTSYAQSGHEIGRTAGHLLSQLIEGRKLETLDYWIPGRLIIRHSSRSIQSA